MQQHIALPVGHGNRHIQLHRRHGALRTQHANDPLALVHQRDQIDEDASRMLDRELFIVDMGYFSRHARNVTERRI